MGAAGRCAGARAGRVGTGRAARVGRPAGATCRRRSRSSPLPRSSTSTPTQARDELARASALAIAFAAGGVGSGDTLAERFLTAWAGEADPDRVAALDAYWVTAAEHGMNASTFTARVVASTGADVGAALSAAVGALCGPLHGGAPARVLQMLDEVEREGDATRYVRAVLDRGERLMGFGHRIYRAEDPRARRAAGDRARARLGPRWRSRSSWSARRSTSSPPASRTACCATNVEFWSAVILDRAGIPAELFTPLFACARTAGWSAHILEQKRSGRLIRPTARYVGD